MANNRLKEILEEEGIQKGKVLQLSGISSNTFSKVYNKKRSVAPTTEGKIVRAVNRLSKREYHIYEVFPERKNRKLLKIESGGGINSKDNFNSDDGGGAN